jgi:hypothetical protein
MRARNNRNVLQEVFSMWSGPCQLLRNRPLNTFTQKETRGTVYLLLGNGLVPCKVFIRESVSEAGSSVQFSSSVG